MQACELALLMWLTTLTGSGQSQVEWVTLQTEPQPLFEGDTLTLRCLIRDGSTVKWVYFYKDGTVLHDQSTTELRVERFSKKQDGIYKCSATWRTETIYSAEVRVSVTDEQVTLQTEPQPLFEGDTLTLRCLIRDGSTVKWVYFYKDGTVLHYQSTTELRMERVSKKQDGIYKCSARWWSETIYSAEVRVSVTDEQVTLQTEPQPLFEGETLTLRCLIRDVSTVKWVYFYKDGTVLKYQSTTEMRVERVSKKQDGIYKCSATWQTETIYSAEVRVSVTELPQPALTREPSGEIFEGYSVTLSCVVEEGSGGWRYFWYKDSQSSPPVYQTDSSSGTGAGYTISAAALSHSGEYWCRAERSRTSLNSQYSKALRIQVHELPQPALTREPSGEIFKGDAVTLSCVVEEGSGGWRYLWYKDSESSPPVYQTDSSSGTGAGYTISAAALYHSGEYWCRAERSRTSLNSQYSKDLRIQVHELPQPALTREPSGEIFEGDAVTLSCGVEGGSGGWRYLWYKDSQSSPPVYQTDSSSGTGTGYTISAAALSHSGEYWCKCGRKRTSLNSQYSHPIWVNVTVLFSRVTLTASPGVTVKEGEALNLTCEAAVNKSPRPQLHYTIVRDGEPVTSSTDSALYSIASTEKSNTGSYACAVESQGVRKSSQELHIEVQTSWHSAVAVGYRVSFFLIHLTVFTLLLLQYCRIRGYVCIPGVKSRKPRIRIRSSQQRGLSSPAVQQTGVELE